jgi:hypothetical protein
VLVLLVYYNYIFIRAVTAILVAIIRALRLYICVIHSHSPHELGERRPHAVSADFGIVCGIFTIYYSREKTAVPHRADWESLKYYFENTSFRLILIYTVEDLL